MSDSTNRPEKSVTSGRGTAIGDRKKSTLTAKRVRVIGP